MLTTVRHIFGRIMHSETALHSQWDKGRKNNLLFASPSIRRPTSMFLRIFPLKNASVSFTDMRNIGLSLKAAPYAEVWSLTFVIPIPKIPPLFSILRLTVRTAPRFPYLPENRGCLHFCLHNLPINNQNHICVCFA